MSHTVPTNDFPLESWTKLGLNGLDNIPHAEANGSPNPKYNTLISSIFLSGMVIKPAINTPVKKKQIPTPKVNTNTILAW